MNFIKFIVLYKKDYVLLCNLYSGSSGQSNATVVALGGWLCQALGGSRTGVSLGRVLGRVRAVRGSEGLLRLYRTTLGGVWHSGRVGRLWAVALWGCRWLCGGLSGCGWSLGLWVWLWLSGWLWWAVVVGLVWVWWCCLWVDSGRG